MSDKRLVQIALDKDQVKALMYATMSEMRDILQNPYLAERRQATSIIDKCTTLGQLAQSLYSVSPEENE